MMNPNAANKPPPAFIRRTIDPTFAAKEAMSSKLEIEDNLELDKPIMKRKKRRGKVGAANLLDDKKLEPIQEEKKESIAPPSKPKEIEKSKEVEKPKEVVKPKLPEIVKEPEPPKVESQKPAAAKPKGAMAFLDDSDEDEDDDFFSKKPKPTPISNPNPPKAAAGGTKSKAMFLDSDDEDNGSDGSFD
jgi:NADH dehydrogenase/NADH:ubiquinone oxidoreductase subunit G